MADHLQHGAAQAQIIDGCNPQQNKAHVTHGAAGDASLDVVLGERVEGPIDHIDDAKHHQGWGELQVNLRQHLHVEAQQGVTAHLEQHPGQQH